jgi:hypothetical protein
MYEGYFVRAVQYNEDYYLKLNLTKQFVHHNCRVIHWLNQFHIINPIRVDLINKGLSINSITK